MEICTRGQGIRESSIEDQCVSEEQEMADTEVFAVVSRHARGHSSGREHTL